MKGLIFESFSPRDNVVSNRTDVVCFIGFCGMREVEPPENIRQWLQHEGWWGTASIASAQKDAATLYEVPLPFHNWESFDQLFAWNQRVYAAAGEEITMGATYLGAAVRSYFAQGGRKCYVISCGEPLLLNDDRKTRDFKLQQLIPSDISKGFNRSQWRGLQHLLGLPEVSFLAFPDLAELVSLYRDESATPVEIPPPEPVFVECSQPSFRTAQEKQVVHLAAPACTDSEYATWGSVVRRAVQWIAANRREVQLVAALPLPRQESDAANDLLVFMHRQAWLSGVPDVQDSIASGFLQLVYPWLRTAYAGDLPANLEPPEGVLSGLLARNALTRGGFRSATALSVSDIVEFHPKLPQSQQFGLNPKAPTQASPQSPLIDRISLLGSSAEGFRLLSDVTTSNDKSYRQASINRTIALVLRAARNVGEAYVFETSGERLWQQIVASMGDLLTALQAAGALAGKTASDAFQVRCDHSTMTQQDIDSGRVIVQVMIIPAASIETMRIQLTIGDGGRVSLAALGMEAA